MRTKVQQLQISGTLASSLSDGVALGDLIKANRTLNDDLNSLRSQIKRIQGTDAWTDQLSGLQDLADIYTALRVNPTSGIAGFQNDVFVTGSLSGSGNFSVGGNITLQGNLDSDVDETKTLFGSLTMNSLTLGGGGLVVTAGDLRVGGNDIRASDDTIALTLLGADVMVAGDLLVGGNDIKNSENQVALTFVGDGGVNVTGDLLVGGNDIKSSVGDTAITLSGANVIIPGDLTVNGITTTINTTNLEIKDSVVGLGFASGTIQESAGDRGWIGGIASDNNVAFFWDNSATEFVAARTTNSATGSLPIPIASYSNFRAAEISGNIVRASMGLSGSLTKLTDGTSYLLGGSGITITSASNGAITITNNATSQTIKGYLTGDNANINTGTGVVNFGPAGANIGTLAVATDEVFDVFLNGVFMSYGYDITDITTTTFTFDSTIASSLTADDIVAIVIRQIA